MRRTRLSLGTAALFAACAALWMTSPAGPPRPLVALFDSDWQADFPFESTDALEVRAPLSMGEAPLADMERSLRAAANGVASVLARDDGSDRIFMLLPARGVPNTRLEALVEPGMSSLAFLPVLDEGDTADAIRTFMRARGVDGPGPSPISADSEAELIAGLEAMRDECTPCRPRAGESLIIEHDNHKWSALVVSHRAPVFDRSYILRAEAARNAYDERPVALLYFTDDGRRAFQALSRGIVGQRLAIVVQGQVVSSPRVMQEIDTDRIEVSAGATTLEEGLREANRIADALTPGADLPAGVTWSWRTLPAASGAAMALASLVTLLLAALLGALFAKVLAAFERHVGIASAPTPTMAARTWPSATLLVTRVIATLLTLAAPFLVTQIPIPILDLEVLTELGASSTSFGTLGTAGLTPLVLAFILVSLIVWLVPSLASLRTGSFDARRRLLLPTALITFALCTLQAVGMTPLFTDVGLLEPTVFGSILLALSFTAGTFLLWGAASLATFAGIGHGFSLLAVGAVLYVVIDEPTMIADGRTQATVLLISVMMAYAATRRLLTPLGARRLPLCGLTPVEVLGLIQAVLLLVSLLVDGDFRTPQLGLWASLAVFIALTIGLSWLVAKPIPTRPFVHALVPTTVLVLSVVQGAALLAELGPEVAPMNLAELLALFFFVPIALDVGDELRATLRYGRLSRVSSTHAPDEADRLIELLAARDIPAIGRGIRHRTLLRFLAPHVPIEVLVPLTERRAALAFLREDAIGEVVAPFGDEPTEQPVHST